MAVPVLKKKGGGFNAAGSVSKPLECLCAEYLKNRGVSFKVLGGGDVAVVKGKTSPDLKNLGIFAAEIRDREVKLLPGSIIRSRMDHIPAWNVNTHTLSSEERRSCRFWKPACIFLPVWVYVHPIKIAGSLQSAVICTVVYCGILKMGGLHLN